MPLELRICTFLNIQVLEVSTTPFIPRITPPIFKLWNLHNPTTQTPTYTDIWHPAPLVWWMQTPGKRSRNQPDRNMRSWQFGAIQIDRKHPREGRKRKQKNKESRIDLQSSFDLRSLSSTSGKARSPMSTDLETHNWDDESWILEGNLDGHSTC